MARGAQPPPDAAGEHLSVPDALLLGALQGPSELLPVSSSGHLTLVPHLLGLRYTRLPADVRKAVEVALHVGSAPVVAIAAARQPRPTVRHTLLALGPPALAGLVLERVIESRLGTPRSVAAAQVLAGAALLVADLRGARRETPDDMDHLFVGLAQAAALVPGVSRAGAAVTAGRARGLSRRAATALALGTALPVTAGAGVLKGARLLRGDLPREHRAALAAGAGAALATGLAALPFARRSQPLRAIAAYRIALGALALLAKRR
jgi:undecaprenyl-diphosphatase